MPLVTELAHRILRPVVLPGAWAVDATTGNGHDTEFLAACVGPTGRVFGFDVQAQALAATAVRVKAFPHVTLVQAGHETMRAYLPSDAQGRLAAVMFNLGYLPGAAKDVTTTTETTLAALHQALSLLALGGLVTIALYPGHRTGSLEAEAVRDAAQGLPAAFAATILDRVNAARSAPQLIIVEKLR